MKKKKNKWISFGIDILHADLRLEDVVTDIQAAAYLGISISALKKLMMAKVIPFYTMHVKNKNGTLFLFTKKDLYKYKEKLNLKIKSIDGERCL